MVSGQLPREHQPESFRFSAANARKAKEIIARYPSARARSAIMPLLYLAQDQIAQTGPYGPYPNGGGWIPVAAMDEIARLVDQPPIKVYEVATFYTMYNLAPVGKYHIQVCGTTPCMLCGSEDILAICRETLGIGLGETTDDGLFSLIEVECLGACCNAPMVQINEAYYEDLTPNKMREIIGALKKGDAVPIGSQVGRTASEPVNGLTSLTELVPPKRTTKKPSSVKKATSSKKKSPAKAKTPAKKKAAKKKASTQYVKPSEKTATKPKVKKASTAKKKTTKKTT